MSNVNLESLFKALAANSIEDYDLAAYQHLDTDAARLEYIKAVRDELRTALESKREAIVDLESEADTLMELDENLVTVIKRLRLDLSIDPVEGQLPLLPHDPSEAVSQAQSSVV